MFPHRDNNQRLRHIIICCATETNIIAEHWGFYSNGTGNLFSSIVDYVHLLPLVSNIFKAVGIGKSLSA